MKTVYLKIWNRWRWKPYHEKTVCDESWRWLCFEIRRDLEVRVQRSQRDNA